jgi:large subunit ribosomal protein L21
MYAVVSSGGKQYRVEAGSELVIERLAADAGGTITFDRVLLVGDGEDVTIGTPVVEGATVSGTVLGEALGPKLIVFKFKQKATYRRKRGHRQHLVRVRIDEISAGGKRGRKGAKAEAKAESDAVAEPETPKAKPTARTRKAPAKASTAKKATAADEESKAGAADAEADEPKTKPAPRRRTPAKKAKAEE